MWVPVQKGDYIQGTTNPPGTSEMWRERPTATLHCNVRSDKRGQKPSQKPEERKVGETL